MLQLVEFSKYDAQIRKKLELFFEVKCIEKKKYEKYKVETKRKQKCAINIIRIKMKNKTV